MRVTIRSMATSNNFKKELIKRLKDLIDLGDQTVAGIERKLGKGRGYVGDALRGKKRLSFDVVLHILRALGIAPEDFFGDEVAEEKQPKEKALQKPAQKVVADSVALLYNELVGGKSPTPKRIATVLWGLVQLLERKGHIDDRELLAVLEEIQDKS